MSATEINPTAAAESQHGPEEEDHRMFGFVIFLLSETVIFLSFFVGYIVFKTSAGDNWLPAGFEGLEVRDPAIATAVLLSSSGVIYVAERYLHKDNLWGFRIFWLLTMVMGGSFLAAQAVEWTSLPFGFTSGVFGGTFYLLTGFHGLHVLTGVVMQGVMLGRSFIPGNYDGGEHGVASTSIFWHFVDVIWIVLFSLIYLWQ